MIDWFKFQKAETNEWTLYSTKKLKFCTSPEPRVVSWDNPRSTDQDEWNQKPKKIDKIKVTKWMQEFYNKGNEKSSKLGFEFDVKIDVVFELVFLLMHFKVAFVPFPFQNILNFSSFSDSK